MRTALRALLNHRIRGLLHPSIERGVVRGRVLMRSCAVLITVCGMRCASLHAGQMMHIESCVFSSAIDSR